MSSSSTVSRSRHEFAYLLCDECAKEPGFTKLTCIQTNKKLPNSECGRCGRLIRGCWDGYYLYRREATEVVSGTPQEESGK